MNSISIRMLSKGLAMLCLVLLTYTGFSQTTVQMTFSNMVQTGVNTFEYSAYITNTGTTALKLRNYSWGLNPTTGLSNGGTLTHSFLSRDASLAAIPGLTASFVNNQLRVTTLSAPTNSEVTLPAGVPIRMGTMRVTTTTSWPFPNFNPFAPSTGTAIQVVTAGGKTQCVATCIVTPPGTAFTINGTGNTPATGQIQGLSGVMTPSPIGSSPFLLNPCTAVVSNVSATTCSSYTWAITGLTYTTSGVYFNTTSQGGSSTCFDSLYLHLTINNTTSNITPVTACDSYTWSVSNQTYTTSGVYSVTSLNAAGCQHTETLNLTINNSTASSSSVTSCDSYTWPIDGQTYVSSGIYTYTSLNSSGCLHTETLNLTINSSTSSVENITACDTYLWNGGTYTITGMYTTSYLNSVGCTHLDTLNLIINASTTDGNAIATACDSYTWNGTTYTTTGMYTKTSTNAAGCINTATLDLTINYSTTNGNATVTACDSYTWNGSTYTTSGVYTYTSLNAAGCTNTAMLDLTINYSTTNGNATVTACDSYTWNGATYTTSGVYTYTSLNAAGCTNTATLDLTINYSTTDGNAAVTACDSYTWNGATYTTSGVYTYTSLNAAGCTNTAMLTLTVNHSNSGSSSVNVCDSYTWNGNTFTTSGNPTHTYTNMAGCDSVHTLNLTIRHSSTSSVSVTAYGCYTWSLNGQSYPTSGSYPTTLTNAVGCDSIITLNVTVVPGITIKAKAILAGPYNASSGLMNDSLRVLGMLPMTEPYSGSPYFLAGGGQTISPSILSVSGANAIVDWVYLEIRNAATPSVIIATQRALIQRDGDVVSYMDGVSPVYFGGVPAGNYYVSIKQRNHLGVMTASSVPVNSCSATIDFTTGTVWVKQDPLALQNGPRQLIGSVYALWAGDANVDKRVRGNGLSNDKDFIVTALGGNTNNVLGPVYRTEDLNLDGKIRFNGTNNDKNVIVNTDGISTPNNTVYQHTPN